MRSLILILLVSNLVDANASGSDLPYWITKGQMSDNDFRYVVCSDDGIDPEEARQIAESKCLASAATLDGVDVRIAKKTIQSLTGSDASEVAEIQPLERHVNCEWTDRYLEPINAGFRVWLRCKVSKKAASPTTLKNAVSFTLARSTAVYAEATLVVSTVPQADRIIVSGLGVERVLEPTSNVISFKVTNLDTLVTVKKLGYRDFTIEISKVTHGGKLVKDAILQKN